MGFEFGNSFETKPFLGIRLEEGLNEVFCLLGYHSFFFSDLGPLNLAFENILEDFLDFHGCKGSDSDHDFVGDDAQWPYVPRRVVEFTFDDFGGDVVGWAKELVNLFLGLLTGCQHKGQVEVSQLKEALFVDDYVFLN